MSQSQIFYLYIWVLLSVRAACEAEMSLLHQQQLKQQFYQLFLLNTKQKCYQTSHYEKNYLSWNQDRKVGWHEVWDVWILYVQMHKKLGGGGGGAEPEELTQADRPKRYSILYNITLSNKTGEVGLNTWLLLRNCQRICW